MPAETNSSIAVPVSVPNGGTGLTSGTSGGIPAYTGATTIASSGVLSAGAIMIGGGAGVAPSTTTTGTGVLTTIARPTFLSTATTVSPGTTTLVVGSAVTHEATGVYTHTYKMPVVTTLVAAGWAATFINKSTGAVTIQSSGNNSIVVLAGGQSVTLVCRSLSADTTAAAWDVVGLSPSLWLALRKSADQVSVTDNTETTVTFNTITGGTMQSSWNTGTSTFTAPVTGLYELSGVVNFYSGVIAAAGGSANLIYKLNGGSAQDLARATIGLNASLNTLQSALAFVATISLTAGDTIIIRGTGDNGGDGDWSFDATSQLNISKQ